MAATVTGVREIVFALRQHGEVMEQEMGGELHAMAGFAATRMKTLAPTGLAGTLVNSIRERQVGQLSWEIGANVGYAEFVEKGSRPGKGLPRFLDPAAASIVAWLQKKAFSGKARVRRNTMAAVNRNLELRDRYEGLAWHVRHFGVKAQPFVEPTAREMETVFPRRMDLAARRVLARGVAGSSGGGGSAVA